MNCNPQRKIAGNYSYETECFGSESDGSQTIKVWGNGRNRSDAVEQAMKNGISDVIFKGILYGKQDCDVRPLISEPNARDKYQDYFNTFFSDNGPYKEYVNVLDERNFSKLKRDRKGAIQSFTHGIVLRVLRSELKKRLITDKILK